MLVIEPPPADQTTSAIEITPTNAPAAPPATTTETILVVEDRQEVRELAREILESNGYEVIEARDPMEALSIAAQHPAPIDLLLTDLVMPQMNGLELAKRLKSLRPEIQVLYMSGFVSSGTLTAKLVKKPFEPDTLTEKVREVLDASRGPSS
jgi:CheY-like chemotaxis protein